MNWINTVKERKKIMASNSEFALARRLCYLKINLDTILENTRILKAKCAKHTGWYQISLCLLLIRVIIGLKRTKFFFRQGYMAYSVFAFFSFHDNEYFLPICFGINRFYQLL